MDTEMTVERVWTGGGTWKPEGKSYYVNATWPLVSLVLDDEGGRLVTIHSPDIPFSWREVESVKRIQGLLPWDTGVRFALSKERGKILFNFITLTRKRTEEVLSLVEGKGITVDWNKHRAWLS